MVEEVEVAVLGTANHPFIYKICLQNVIATNEQDCLFCTKCILPRSPMVDVVHWLEDYKTLYILCRSKFLRTVFLRIGLTLVREFERQISFILFTILFFNLIR